MNENTTNSPGITEREAEFMLQLTTDRHWCLRHGKASPRIQSLIDRGYCRTSPERLGPLGIYTGEVCIMLTDAGRLLVPDPKVRDADTTPNT